MDRDTRWLRCAQPTCISTRVLQITSNSDQISLAIKIAEDFSWTLQVHSRSIEPHACSILSAVPQSLVSAKLVGQLICQVEQSSICQGNPDEKFISLAASRKGIFVRHSGRWACKFLCMYIHCTCCPHIIATVCYVCLRLIGNEVVARSELQPHKTIRHSQCELLVEGGKRCSFCASHRITLRVLLGRHDGNTTPQTSSLESNKLPLSHDT